MKSIIENLRRKAQKKKVLFFENFQPPPLGFANCLKQKWNCSLSKSSLPITPVPSVRKASSGMWLPAKPSTSRSRSSGSRSIARN